MAATQHEDTSCEIASKRWLCFCEAQAPTSLLFLAMQYCLHFRGALYPLQLLEVPEVGASKQPMEECPQPSPFNKEVCRLGLLR